MTHGCLEQEKADAVEEAKEEANDMEQLAKQLAVAENFRMTQVVPATPWDADACLATTVDQPAMLPYRGT